MNNSDQITSIVSFVLLVILLFIFFLSMAIRYRKRKKENELLKAGYLLELQKVNSEIQEETLRYVSRELHDNLGQIASLIKINLHTINADLLPTDVREKVEGTRDLMRRLTHDIKMLSVGLGNHDPNQSFLDLVKNEILQLNKTGLFQAALQISDDFTEPEQEKNLMVFRMVQEVINNIIKHSQATELNANFFYKNGASVIELQDNGIGFDTSQPSPVDSSGLNNLRNRAHLINADLKIKSRQPTGTTVTITLT